MQAAYAELVLVHIATNYHVMLIVLSGLVGTYVGLRLLQLARRTRMLPELQVGLALLSWSVVGQPLALYLGPWSSGLSESALALCYLGYWLSWVGVYTGLAFFCRQVFDASRSPLRRLLFWISWVPGVFALGIMVIWGRAAGPIPEAICNLTCGIGFGWAGAEALIYWTKLRRRAALGLSDPVVTNRFLLWGGCCAATSPIAFWVCWLALHGLGLGSGYAPAELATSVGGLVNGAVWMLTFVPPAFYTRAIRAHAVRRAATEG
jgi:hypothetical protein